MSHQPVIPEEDLPTWIRSAHRGIDWGGVIVLLLALLVSSLYWQTGLITLENNSIHGAFRAYDITVGLREGVLYPRWSAHAVYGFGAPILHFAPPLMAYLAALLTWLFTDHILTSLSALMTLALVTGSTATYAFALQHVGARAALVAALSYLLSPAFVWLLPYQLGDLDAALAVGLLPLFIWSLDRALRRTSPLDLPLLSVAFALLLLSHPTHLALVALFLGTVVCCLRWNAARSLWLRLLTSLLIGLALSAIYGLPAALEAGAVQWQTLPTATWPPITLMNLLLPFSPADPAAGNPAPIYSLGSGVVLLIIGNAVWRTLRRCWQRFDTAWAFACLALGAGAVLFNCPVLVPPAAWCGALAGAGFVSSFPREHTQQMALAAALVVITATFLPVYLTFQRPTNAVDFDFQAQLQYELRGYGVAGVLSQQPVPSNLPLAAPPNLPLLAAYNRALPDRLTLLTGTPDKIVLMRAQHQASLYTVASASPLSAVYTVAPFIGWQATLNNMPLTLSLSSDSNAYLLDIPPIRAGELRIRFGSTPYRDAGGLVSILGLVALGLWWRSQHRRKDWQMHFPRLLTSTDVRVVAVVAVVLGILASAWLSGRFLPSPQPSSWSGLANSTMLTYPSNSSLQLIGYHLDNVLHQPMMVKLHWRATRPIDEAYALTAALISTTGERVFESSVIPLAHLPTTSWRVDRYYTTHLLLRLPDLPRGRYTLTLRVFPCRGRGLVCTTARALTFFDERGVHLGTQLTLPRILTQP